MNTYEELRETFPQLCKIADENNLVIDCVKLKHLRAFAIPGTIVIDLSQFDDESEVKVCLAHELGHNLTLSFYTLDTLDTLEQKEAAADRWAIYTLIPFKEYLEALTKGCKSPCELAKCFGVTEVFASKAIQVYGGMNH